MRWDLLLSCLIILVIISAPNWMKSDLIKINKTERYDITAQKSNNFPVIFHSTETHVSNCGSSLSLTSLLNSSSMQGKIAPKAEYSNEVSVTPRTISRV